jgi:hypothetical protein
VRALLAASILLAVSGGTALADDKVKAIALFDEGKKELAAGNVEKACKAFEASNRLLPDSGTRGSLAICYTRLGRIASAWTLWRELSDTAPPDMRGDAAAQAKKLEPRLPKYTIKVAAPAAPGLVVKLEGKPVDATIDVPVPIDPGTYPVEASAPGHVTWKGELTAAEGQLSTVDIPALSAAPVSGPIKKPPVANPGRGRRIAGLALATAGVGGLVVGGIFGAKARSLNADAEDLCGGDIDRCDPARTNDAQAKVDDARSAANLSTIGFAAGGALVATGIVLFVTAPKAERRAVTVSPLVGNGTTGLVLSGRY